MDFSIRNIVVWIFAAVVVFLFWNVSSRIEREQRLLSLNEFIAELDSGNVRRATVRETEGRMRITADLSSGEAIRTFAPLQMESLVYRMLENGVEVNIREGGTSTLELLINWAPIAVMVVVIALLMRIRRITDASGKGSPFAWQDLPKENRLQIKSRCFQALSVSELSEEELISALAEKGLSGETDTEVRKALYEMLTDGTLVFTAEGKYRLRTTP